MLQVNEKQGLSNSDFNLEQQKSFCFIPKIAQNNFLKTFNYH